MLAEPKLVIEPERDELLTEFGKQTLADRYTQPGEGPQEVFARVARAYGDDQAHARRLYDYMSRGVFMPSTPILSNGGRDTGLPISCYLNGVEDSMDGIVRTWNENVALGRHGGGIGTYWGTVRSLGEEIKGAGKTSGIIPFIRVMDSMTMAISQGSQRRGAAAVYIDVSHPEVEEFLDIRSATGDANRKALFLHHGIALSDEFMGAVLRDEPWNLISPKDGSVQRTVSAWELWTRILETRLRTGEPYLIFSDTASKAMPRYMREAGLKVRQSNLCAEIALPVGRDHLGGDRTAVCCLASLNALFFDEWGAEGSQVIEDVLRLLDNVLEDFIQRAPSEFHRAVYSAQRERSVGLGLMGFHSLLQSRSLPFGGAGAKSWNLKMFRRMREEADRVSRVLAEERGPCLDAADAGELERFSHKMAVAPTASISIICGGVSAGIDPIPANAYVHKTLSGSFEVRNPYLEAVLESHGRNDNATWSTILEKGGSVQHLDFLSERDKEVFQTEFEVDQRWIIELAGDRAPYICQSQSVNLFIPADVEKWDLHMIHWRAYEAGLKSLYYLRSKSIRRGITDTGQPVEIEPGALVHEPAIFQEYPECLACQ